MSLRDTPIRQKLMTVMLLTSGLVLLLTCAAFVSYEFLTFRNTTLRQLATLGQIVAAQSAAALASDNEDAAREALAALDTDPHIVAAALYDRSGRLFASHPASLSPGAVPSAPRAGGYRREQAHFVGFEPVLQGGNRRLGTLYIKSDRGGLSARLQRYGSIAVLMFAVSLLVAYFLSRTLQRQISQPILELADVARAVSDRQDYSVRAPALGRDELGLLTNAFNHMLGQIHERTHALQESEGRNRAVVESALDGIIAMDHQGRIVAFNPGAERIFGFQSSHVIGRPLADVIIPPTARAQHRQGLAHYLATGEGPVVGRRIEVTGQRADGSLAAIELSIMRMPGAGPPMFIGFLRDITERQQAEQKMQTQLARLDLLNRITRGIGERQDLRSIFEVVLRNLEDNLPIDFGCVCLYDAADARLTVSGIGLKSQSIARALGMNEGARVPVDQDGLARCIRGQLVYEPDLTAVHFAFPQRLASEGLRSLIVAPLLLESQVFGVLIAVRIQPNSFSSLDCEFVRQLSEHVALASHQAQIHVALQQAYDDLRLSQQAVAQQERLRALGQMASGIAHDINNAISPAMLYTQALLESEPGLSAQAREYLETIERAVDDVAATVARMREFYRQREPQSELTPSDLNNLVPQVLHLTRAWWTDLPQQRGVVIQTRTDLQPGLPSVMVAESEIREALTNLIFNAVDAMPDGGTLTIRTRVSPRAGPPLDRSVPQRVHIEVIDTGLGMDEETRRRCLEPFFTTKGERGTGLGLAMVYGVVQRHSADIDLESTLGQGTTVRLSFAVPAETVADSAAAAAAVRLSPLRVLLVDDDVLLLKTLRNVLEHDGHEVVTANGGQEGVEAFRAAIARGETFGVVITDLGMPYVNGRQVAIEVKRVSESTPVILLTGWGQRLAAEGDVPPHVDRLLSKPPKLRDLREALAYCAALGHA